MVMGGFNLLPLELQRKAVLTAKWNWKSHRYDFKISIVEQLYMKHSKEEIILEKNLENTLKDYINALYLLKKDNSKRCWRTNVIALENYLGLKSESARLEAMRVSFMGDY